MTDQDPAHDTPTRSLLQVPDLLVRLVSVPRTEIDALEKKTARNFKRRTTRKAYAKAGRIVEPVEK